MKRTIKLIILCAILLLILTSCRTLSVKMGDSSRFTLLPPSAITEPMDSYQLITGSFPGYENVAIEAWFTSDESSLNLVMFAPTGQTMGKVFYDGKDVSFESTFLPEYRIIGLYIIADMQLCFADSEAIKSEFGKSDLKLTETYSNGSLFTRTIEENNNAVYLIVYQENGISVINKLRNYEYTIEFLD